MDLIHNASMQFFGRLSSFGRALAQLDSSQANTIYQIDLSLKRTSASDWRISPHSGYDAMVEVPGYSVHINCGSEIEGARAFIRSHRHGDGHILSGAIAERFQYRWSQALEREELQREKQERQFEKDLKAFAIQFAATLDEYPQLVNSNRRQQARPGYDFKIQMQEYAVEFRCQKIEISEGESRLRFELLFSHNQSPRHELQISGEDSSRISSIYYRANSLSRPARVSSGEM